MIALNSARGKARDAKRVADIRQLATALEAYSVDHNDSYPDQPTYETTIPYLTEYVATIPVSPLPADSAICAERSVSRYINNDYLYKSTTTDGRADFNIKFCIGSQVENVQAGQNYLNSSGIHAGTPPL